MRAFPAHDRFEYAKGAIIITSHVSDAQNSAQKTGHISTPRLKSLLTVHLEPINLIIFKVSHTIPNLGASFPLICFQQLSKPDIATLRCSWWNSRQTRGQFIPVLSY